ncbi:MAG: ATP phosphoribosyltransferase regulatory subunit [Pseudomonadota bacterium]
MTAGHAAEIAALEAEVTRLLSAFAAAGATRVAPDALQPAQTLLDLYGEDIRARAYTTHDPVLGERMLRPDFTVPVARQYLATGAAEARYCYAGPVWRRQEPGSDRPAEYLQAGIELFGAADAAAADAEIFALIAGLLDGRELTVATGDIGILIAAVEALPISTRRRAALRRHIWRPARFQALLASFVDPPAPSETRRKVLAAVAAHQAEALVTEAGPEHGLRSPAEIVERLQALAEAAEEPPLDPHYRDLLDRLLAVRAPSAEALATMRRLARDLPGLDPALDRLDARLQALSDHGIDAATLPFEASYGRTSLEYYDGFVFGFLSTEAGRASPVASGGRYDTLIAVLAADGRPIPAIGAIIRPGAVASDP